MLKFGPSTRSRSLTLSAPPWAPTTSRVWQPEQRSEKSWAPCLTERGHLRVGRDARADALRAARGEDAGGGDGEGSEQDAATDHEGRHHTRRLPLRRATRGLECPAPAGLVAAVEAGAGLAGGVRRYCPSSSHGARSRPLPAGRRPLPHRRDRRDLPGPRRSRGPHHERGRVALPGPGPPARLLRPGLAHAARGPGGPDGSPSTSSPPARRTSRARSPPSAPRPRSSRPPRTGSRTGCPCSTARSGGWPATCATSTTAGTTSSGSAR